MKKIVGWSVFGVVIVLVLWVAIAAASIGGEASQADALLKQAMQNHEAVATVNQHFKALGYKLEAGGPTAIPGVVSLSGRGPDHWAVIYRTWLTLTVTGDQEGIVHGYHLDRAGSIF